MCIKTDPLKKNARPAAAKVSSSVKVMEASKIIDKVILEKPTINKDHSGKP